MKGRYGNMLLFILSSLGIVCSFFWCLLDFVVSLTHFLSTKNKQSRTYIKYDFLKILKSCTLIFTVSLIICLVTSHIINTTLVVEEVVQEEVINFDNLLLQEDAIIKISDNNSFKVIKTTTYTKYEASPLERLFLLPIKDTSSVSYTIYIPAELAK